MVATTMIAAADATIVLMEFDFLGSSGWADDEDTPLAKVTELSATGTVAICGAGVCASDGLPAPSSGCAIFGATALAGVTIGEETTAGAGTPTTGVTATGTAATCSDRTIPVSTGPVAAVGVPWAAARG